MQSQLVHILEALGNAMFWSLWQTGFLWLIVATYIKLFKTAEPRQIAGLGFVALLTGFVAFITTFAYSLFADRHAILLPGWGGASVLRDAYVWISAFYVCVLFYKITCITWSYFQGTRLKFHSTARVPGHLKIFMLDASAHLGIRRRVSIWVSALVHSPVTIGFIKPVILLPIAAINQLSVQQLEAVILHELSHIRRNDYLINLVSKFIVAFLHFNPFIRAFDALIEMEREKSADDWVVRFEHDKTAYASALFTLAKLPAQQRATLAIAASGNNMMLLNRIEWMLGNRKRMLPGFRKLPVYTLLLLGIIVFAFPGRPLMQEQTAAGAMVGTAPVTNIFTPQFTAFSTADQSPQAKLPVVSAPRSKAAAGTKPAETAAPAINENTGNHYLENLPVQFVFNTRFVTAELPAEEAQKLDATARTTQKILSEANWKQIEFSLGESVTSEDKLKLKEAFQQINREQNIAAIKNRLLIQYDNINWEKATSQLKNIDQSLKIDSLSAHYQRYLNQLALAREALVDDVNAKAALDGQINEVKTALRQLDSLRTKKIVEL